MITISEEAAQEIKHLLKEKNQQNHFVRVSVISGGCSGLTYQMNFDNQNQEADQVFEDKNLKIVVDKKSFFYLIGTELSFSKGLNGQGFHFINPNASRTCACGESFSL